MTEWKCGCKDSCMEYWKKMLLLGIFSTRHKHTINFCLWNSSVFAVWCKYSGGESYFANRLVYFCFGIREMRKAFSSVWNTTVRGDASTGSAQAHWKHGLSGFWVKERGKTQNFLHHFTASLIGWWALRLCSGWQPLPSEGGLNCIKYGCPSGWKAVAPEHLCEG